MLRSSRSQICLRPSIDRLSNPPFPALTNLIAVHNYAGPDFYRFAENLRTLLLVNCAVTNAIILAVGPIIGLLGPRYHSLQDVLIILVAFSGAALSAMLGGTLLSNRRPQGVDRCHAFCS